MDKQKLIEERVALHEKSKALLERAEAEKRELTAEEQQEFDKMHARIEECRQHLDRIVKAEEEEREQARLAESRGRKTDPVQIATPSQEDVLLAYRAWALGGNQTRRHISPEMRAACERLNFDPQGASFESRALNSVTTTQGNYAIPDEMMRSIVEAMVWFGGVRPNATVIPTATGAPLPIPTITDTANTGEIIADSGAVTTTADPTFGQVELGSYKFSSKAILVSVELLQDAMLNLATYLGTMLGRRIGRAQNTYFTTGTGTGEPSGIVTGATQGKTATATNAFTFDELVDLEHSVDVAYRAGARWMVHDTTAAYVRKFKDTDGQYLWQMSLQAGTPDRLDGYPVVINNDLASARTTGQKLVLFGDFSKYNIRDAGGVQVFRADELFLMNHQVAFVAFQRSDGAVTDSTAIKYLGLA